ncbi:hypothetical protein GN156_23045, partial [bacterium LRH843]|nr:hypothetical protein [bacterium LRH843]
EEVWKCYGKQAFAFERIVSVHIAIKDIARMFVADGIAVGEQIFPDNSRSKKITEIKYLKQEGGTYKPLKNEGKITLQSDYNFVEATLFQMPTKYREIAIESSDRAVSARHTKYWPMEVL